MAGATSRTILVCAFPAVITLLTFLWVRKKKKQNSLEDTCILSASSSKIESDNHNSREADTIPEPTMREQPCLVMDKELDASSIHQDDGKTEESISEIENVRSSDQEEESEKQVMTSISSSEKPLDITDSLVQEITNMRIEIVKDSEHCKIEETVVNEQSEPLTRLSYSSTSSSTSDAYLLTEDKIHRHRDCHSDLNHVPEMSPPPSLYSDAHSEGSSDSGKGGSDIIQGSTNDNQGMSGYEDLISSSPASSLSNCALDSTSNLLVYEFELPQELCGRLIGRLGKHVNYIKSQCNANIFIKRHLYDSHLKLCAVEGTQAEIQNGLELIRKRFPLGQFPAVTLVQVNTGNSMNTPTAGIMLPETLQLHLPEGVTCDVILSSMVNAGHFFVQQPTHPTYPSLSRLDICMAACYSQIDAPPMPQPVEAGVICAAPTMGGWYRAQVVHVHENSQECDVKFVDYGGYSCLPMAELRQIRSDFMTLPFQASECYLANVKPIDTVDCDSSNEAKHTSAYGNWSLEASVTFEELAQGQILQALVVGHAEDGVPMVHLYRIQGISTVFINRELVNRAVAQWLEFEARPTTATNAVMQG